jgi:phosphonate transport system substrate-binding protein
MKNLYPVILILIILASGCIGCIGKQEIKLNLSIVEDPDIKENDTAIKVAIGSVTSPKESYVYYEEMINYISKKLNAPVRIIQRRTYSEVNDLIKNNEINFAFICSGPYVEGKKEFGMKLLVAPQVSGRTTYNSYIIVQKNSIYTSILDLRGKKFAFTDPLSNAGEFYPEYRLSIMNETPESFFGKDEKGGNNYIYTYSHDNSIIAVAEGLADAAAVNSLVYEYMKETRPEIISRTRIIEVSPPFANPPVVVPRNIDPFLERRLRDIFMNMDKDEEGQKILSEIRIDRFVNLSDDAYESVREMRDRTR